MPRYLRQRRCAGLAWRAGLARARPGRRLPGTPCRVERIELAGQLAGQPLDRADPLLGLRRSSRVAPRTARLRGCIALHPADDLRQLDRTLDPLSLDVDL